MYEILVIGKNSHANGTWTICLGSNQCVQGDFQVVIGPVERCTELGLTDKELVCAKELFDAGFFDRVLTEFAHHHSDEIIEKARNWINYCFE